MAPKIVLTYFDFPGPAEPARMALAMGGEQWEDKRLTFEEFGALKPTLPFGQVPILEVDGKVVCQSLAILRYAGKRSGLYPTDEVEAVYADMAADAVTDCHMRLAPTMRVEDPVKKLEMRKAMATDFLPMWMGSLEKALKAAGGEYFAGGKLSIGDIAVVCRLQWLKKGILDGIPSTCVDEFPLLLALIERVESEPKIVAYREARAAAQK